MSEPNILVSCRQEEDMGELNFNTFDALLEGGDEEEATAVLDTQQQEQEDQEVLQCWRANWTNLARLADRNTEMRNLCTALSDIENVSGLHSCCWWFFYLEKLFLFWHIWCRVQDRLSKGLFMLSAGSPSMSCQCM